MVQESQYNPTNQSLLCPNCGVKLRSSQTGSGYRLARCWNCGQMMRFVNALELNWKGNLPNPKDLDRHDPSLTLPALPDIKDKGFLVEPIKTYTYPHLQCPKCEHVNYANDSSVQYCVNCGDDLKKSCIVCDQPLYVLDQFCSNCRNDQERAQIELEAFYWQRYNEGKRLAESGNYGEARRNFDLFFSPEYPDDPEQARMYNQARFIYRTSIAPVDGNKGIVWYNRVLDAQHTVQERYVQTATRKAKRTKRRYWVLLAVSVVTMSIASNAIFGAVWAIFLVGPVAGVIAFIILMLLLASIGIN
jgi:predicted amidophosphoribosyltransferase